MNRIWNDTNRIWRFEALRLEVLDEKDWGTNQPTYFPTNFVYIVPGSERFHVFECFS